MSLSYVLDTSALLSHLLDEPGWEIVEHLLEEEAGEIYITPIVWLEFRIRLKEIAPDKTNRERALKIYAELLDKTLPITLEVAVAAFELREAAAGRLPYSDALIAAAAKVKGATLVHRDPHLSAIPSRLVRQQVLPAKSSSSKNT